jgi:hypothetical protein
MARVITFSTKFPSYHVKKGEPTYFVEQFWNSFNVQALDQTFLMDYSDEIKFELNKKIPYAVICNFFASLNQSKREDLGSKNHTIRKGFRWKKGDYFSPRIWSGKPYNSKQITLAPETEIVNVWNIEIHQTSEVLINGKFYCSFGSEKWDELCRNDGLSSDDMRRWFCKLPFYGQIICWNKTVDYGK